MAKLELSRHWRYRPRRHGRTHPIWPTLGDWLCMHQGWRSDLPDELAVGTTIVGVAGAKGMRNRVTWTVRKFDPPALLEITGDGVGGTKYALTMTVVPTEHGCAFSVRIDLGGAPLFGPIGAAAARAVKGDIERSIRNDSKTLYA